jgi:glycosyltransferase 2 family protein
MLVSAVLVWWLLHTVSFAPMVTRMRALQGLDLAVILGLAVAQILLFGVRWWLVGRACAAELRFWSAIRIAFISMFFNQTLPATVGGDIMRAYLANREGVPARRAIAGVLIDRFVGVFALVGLVAATLPAFYEIVHDPRLRASVTTIAIAGMLALGVVLLGGGHFAKLLGRWRLLRPFGSLADDLRSVFARPDAILTTALSLAVHLASVGLVMLLAAAMGLRLAPLSALVLVPPVILIMMIPISLAGWGVRESALVVALAQAGVAAPDALAISIGFGLACLAASLPGGVLWLWKSRTARLEAPA